MTQDEDALVSMGNKASAQSLRHVISGEISDLVKNKSNVSFSVAGVRVSFTYSATPELPEWAKNGQSVALNLLSMEISKN